MFKLYTFSHSSASYRVRIVLALKGLAWTGEAINLTDGSQRQPDFLALNPQGRVPALVTDQGVLTQSLAIIDWLEDTHPSPSIYPKDAFARAHCRAFAHAIAGDIFPLQNLSTRQKFAKDFGADAGVQAQWCADWIQVGFEALEAQLAGRMAGHTGYLFGDTPTLADICLVPQMNSARRYGVALSVFPLLVAADAKARAHPAFVSTAPETQS
jgi:maleylacetoacetate isomerase